MIPGGKAVQSPKIVSVKDQERAISLIVARKFKQRRTPRSGRLLAGLVYCARCRAPLVLKSAGKKNKEGKRLVVPYYVCKNRLQKTCDFPFINADNLDKHAWEVFRALLSNLPKFWNDFRPFSEKDKSRLEKDRKIYQKKISVIKNRLERAVKRSLEVEEGFYKSTLESEILAMEEQLDARDRQLRIITTQLGEIEDQEEISPFEEKAFADKLVKRLEDMKPEKMREGLDPLTRGEILVHWEKGKSYSQIMVPFRMNLYVRDFLGWIERENIIS